MTQRTETSFRLQAKIPAIEVLNKPEDGAGLETHLLLGETIEGMPVGRGWMQVKTADHYEWYIKTNHLGPVEKPTHRVRVPQTLAYDKPTFKGRRTAALSMNALPRILEFATTSGGMMGLVPNIGWVFMDHLAKADEYEQDFVEVMRSFVGAREILTPYEWGSRHITKDCSALLEISLGATGVPCERDVIPLSKSFGELYDPKEHGLRRGVAVFWTGTPKARHIAVMTDAVNCVHASIAEGIRGVIEQPLEQLVADQRRDGNGEPNIFRYLPTYRYA